MSSDELRVVSADLTAAAQFADGIADQLVDRYSQTSEAIAALLDGNWKGAAADACADAWREWRDGFRQVVMGLRDEATAMQTAASQYDATDGDGASHIDGTV